MYRKISDPRMGLYPPWVALALRTPGRGFHTMRGGIDPGERRFHPQFIDPTPPFPSSLVPAPTEHVSRVSLAALTRELQATRELDASTAAVHEL